MKNVGIVLLGLLVILLIPIWAPLVLFIGCAYHAGILGLIVIDGIRQPNKT